MSNVVSLTEFKRKKSERQQRETQPFCGVCFDKDGTTNLLMHVPLQAKNGDCYHGHFCVTCETTFE